MSSTTWIENAYNNVYRSMSKTYHNITKVCDDIVDDVTGNKHKPQTKLQTKPQTKNTTISFKQSNAETTMSRGTGDTLEITRNQKQAAVDNQKQDVKNGFSRKLLQVGAYIDMAKSGYKQIKNYINAVVKLSKPFVNVNDILKLDFKKVKSELNIFFKSDEYKNASNEIKENYRKDLSKIADNCDAEVKKYKELCDKKGTTPKELRSCLNFIKYLRTKEAKIKTLDYSYTNGNKELKMYLTGNMCEFKDPTIRFRITENAIKTRDKDVINLAEDHLSDLESKVYKDKNGNIITDEHGRAVTDQTKAARMFVNPKLTGFNVDDQIKLDKKITSQYGKFGKESQLGIHAIMSDPILLVDSTWSKEDQAKVQNEVLKSAAQNIWLLDKSNQAEAVKITITTQNKEAIEAAASNWAKYDESAKTDIEKSIVCESNCDTAKQILSAVKEFTKKVSDAEVSEIKQLAQDTFVEFKTSQDKNTFNTFQKILMNNPNPVVLLDEINKLSDSAKLALLQQYPNDSVIVNAIFASGASLDVLSKLSPENLSKMDYKKFVGAQLCFLNVYAQIYIVNQCADNGTLGDILVQYLKPEAKAVYKGFIDKIRQQKETQKQKLFLNVRNS